MCLRLVTFCALFGAVVPTFTFRDVIVTCDQRSEKEPPFATVVTTNRLQPHLPKCHGISIEFANIPILHRHSLSQIEANSVHLENNRIEEVEAGAFDGTTIKEVLSLTANNLREIRRGVFNDVGVIVLFLNYNQISYVDYQAFDNMTYLETVYLDHNKLSRIDTFWFGNTSNLKKVLLNHNLIREIPANAFRNVVEKNFSAASISLSHNLIQSIDRNAFAQAKKLNYLDVSFNRLHALEPKWLKGVSVNFLDVSNNRFMCVTEGLAGRDSKNFVDRNPWDCQCLEKLKRKEFVDFGRIVAPEAFRRCAIV